MLTPPPQLFNTGCGRRVGWLLLLLLSGQVSAAPPDKSDDASSASATTASIVDHFSNALRSEWHWRRENRDAWKVDANGLHVLIEPGNMWGPANDAHNVLLFPLPPSRQDQTEVRVQVEHQPQHLYEQADLVWYYDDSHMVKIGLELVDGTLSIVMGREEGDQTRTIAIIPYSPTAVRLRLVVQGGTIHGSYSAVDPINWQPAGECSLPVRGVESTPAQISLQFYQGESQSNRWAQVREFELLPLNAVDK